MDRFGQAHDIDRLARLVSADPDDGFDRKLMLANTADNVDRPHAVRFDRLLGKVFAVRNLLQCRSIDDNVHILHGRADILKSSNIPQPKFQAVQKIAIDHFIGRYLAVQV